MMNAMFAECSSLISLPNLSKWNLSKIIMKLSLFDECINSLDFSNKNENNSV